MSKIIGIDLGTTNSVVAVMEGGEPVADVLVGGAEQPPAQPDHEVLRRVGLLGLRFEHAPSGQQQCDAEHVEHPRERGREVDAAADRLL